MPFLVDSNVLLRSAEPAHPMYADAVGALEALRLAGEQPWLVPQNLIEFWAVATRPVERNGLGLSAEQAEAELGRFEALFPVLPETPEVYREWRRLVTTHSVVGVRVHDTRLVAAMIVHGGRQILTFNVDDFARYPDISPMLPQRAP